MPVRPSVFTSICISENVYTCIKCVHTVCLYFVSVYMPVNVCVSVSVFVRLFVCMRGSIKCRRGRGANFDNGIRKLFAETVVITKIPGVQRSGCLTTGWTIICLSVFFFVCTCLSLCVYVYVYVSVYMCMCVSVSLCACVYGCLLGCVCLSVRPHV